MTKEFLTVDEAAEYLRFAKQTVYDYVYKRKIPYFKAGKKLLFKPSELDKWLTCGGDRLAAEKVTCERVIK